MQKNQALPPLHEGPRAEPRVVGFEGIGQMLNEASATGRRAERDEKQEQAWRDRAAGIGRAQEDKTVWERMEDL